MQSGYVLLQPESCSADRAGKLHTGAAKELPTAAVGSPVAPPPRRIRQRLELMSFISLVGLVRSYVGGRLAALLLQALAETREEAKSYQ